MYTEVHLGLGRFILLMNASSLGIFFFLASGLSGEERKGRQGHGLPGTLKWERWVGIR